MGNYRFTTGVFRVLVFFGGVFVERTAKDNFRQLWKKGEHCLLTFGCKCSLPYAEAEAELNTNILIWGVSYCLIISMV